MDRMGEYSLAGAMSSISAVSWSGLARKLTVTFWMGSSKGPETTLYPNKVESNSVVASRDGTATPICNSLKLRPKGSSDVKAYLPFVPPEFLFGIVGAEAIEPVECSVDVAS